ncbi:MAG: hypothetical protein MUE60_04925 [Candidatus Eisenbacteria bacterium]|nr:hypothetical protein [Candidatus Eisenbacteria bacterium]
MHIAVMIPSESANFSHFIAALRALGHEVAPLVLPLDHDGPIAPLPKGIDMAFVQGFTHLGFRLACALSDAGFPVATPPLHTRALLDHPLHWRRVLEREGVPVSPWLLLDSATDVGRDPRASVLGFPLRVSRVRVGVPECILVADRDELHAAGAMLRGPRGILVERCAQGDATPVFTGVSVSGPVSGVRLDEVRAALTTGLSLHVQRVLELAGPCVLDMVWERDRLLLEGVRLDADCGRDGDAHQAAGGEYDSFVAGVLQAAIAP